MQVQCEQQNKKWQQHVSHGQRNIQIQSAHMPALGQAATEEHAPGGLA